MPLEKVRYSTIEGNSRGFWALAGFLLILVVLGGLAALRMETEGHHITGMTNQIPWGFPIVMAVYLIGLSAGSLVLSALSSVFGVKEFKPFARISAVVAASLLVGALLAIILDWGRPDRLLIPFFHMNPRSVFSLNGILYSAYIGICIIYLWAMFAEKERLVTGLGILAVFWAVLVHSGTGAIFGFVGARELYHSPLLPPSFIAAALSSGTALMILVLYATFKYTGRRLDDTLVQKLGRYLAMFIMAVTYLILVENIVRGYFPANYETQEFLLSGKNKYSLAFWIGMVGCGNIFPLIILLIPKYGKSVKAILFSSILVVGGVLAERYIIVIPGHVLPLDIFPGYEISSDFQDGVIANYSISSYEVFYSLGLAAVVFLAYIFLLKMFELMPETNAIDEEETNG